MVGASFLAETERDMTWLKVLFPRILLTDKQPIIRQAQINIPEDYRYLTLQ